MKPAGLFLALLAIVASVVRAQDDGSPHHNLTMCAVCHNEDMSLQRSKLETCTLCHAPTVHGGSNEHLQADAAKVGRWAQPKDSKVRLPLTDDSHIWCGTCHVFHDPSIDQWLAEGWVPPETGLPRAVRDRIVERAARIAKTYGEEKSGLSFAAKGTRALRLPVADGSLCQQCHGSLR